MKTQSSLEPLEPRVAPAGLIKVSVIGGILTLIGDDENNAVSVSVLGNGTVDLSPIGGTQLDFKGAVTGAVLNVPALAPKLMAKLGAGNDNLVLTGNYRSLSADLGVGDDILNLNSLTVGGPTKIVGRDGKDTVLAMAPSVQRFFGNVTLDLGSGDDEASLNGSETIVGGSFSFAGGAGTDKLTLSNGASISGNLTAVFGSGVGTFATANSSSTFQVGGKVLITGANDSGEALQCLLTSGNTRILGGLTILGGNGDNLLQLQSSTKTELNGGLKIQGGTGLTSVFLVSPTTIGNNFSALSNGGLAISHFAMPLSVEGSLTARAGTGSCNFNLSGSVFIGQNLSIGGAKGGNINLTPGVQVGKNISINFGGSPTTTVVFVTGVTAGGALSTTSGSDNDAISVDDLKVIGKLSINTGVGNDTISIEHVPAPGIPSLFTGPINVNAGAGNDSVAIGILGMSQMIGFAKVQLIGGAGTDTLSFAANGNVLFAGSSTTGFETGT